MNLPVRPAVTTSPDYPFTPVEAPIKLNQNESPEDFPEHMKAEVFSRLARLAWNRYPDLHAQTLATHIAKFESWDADATIVTTGSNVLISLLIQLSALESRVLTVKPNFALYALDGCLLGAQVVELPLREDLSIDIGALIAEVRRTPAVSEGGPAGVLYVPRPHAPVGSACALDELEALVDAARGWLVVIDEAYCHYAGEDAKALARRHEHVVLLRTFSKAWSLAGIRLGYALTGAAVARQLRKIVPPFTISVLQAVAAQVALEQSGYMLERVARGIRERERLFEALRQHPTWRVYRSQANFLLIRTPDAARAYHRLLARGVLVRRQDNYFGLEGCIRVSIGTPQENDVFLHAALQPWSTSSPACPP